MKDIKRYTFIHNNMVLGGLMRSDNFVIESDHKAVVETMQKEINVFSDWLYTQGLKLDKHIPLLGRTNMERIGKALEVFIPYKESCRTAERNSMNYQIKNRALQNRIEELEGERKQMKSAIDPGYDDINYSIMLLREILKEV